MVKKTNGKVGALALSAIALALPTSASASEIALTFKGGEVTLTGEFAGFKESAYIVETDLGEIYVPAIMVTCEGPDCFEFVVADGSDS